jgi:hypothetical protein
MSVGQCKYIACFFICLFFLQHTLVAQKTYRFKVRAPQTSCTIAVKDSLLWLDKDNVITVNVTHQTGSIKVKFANGTVIKRNGNEFTVTFDNGGKTVISVYQYMKGNFRLIYSESRTVEEPTIYFCGVKVGTKSGGLKMREEHIVAKSVPYNNSMLKIKGYDMIYFDGVTSNTFHSDSTELSKTMTDIIFEKPQKKGDQSFRFGLNKRLYFTNIAAIMPDGKNKFLTPFELFLEQDSAKTDDIAFIFSVRRVYAKK